jgi:hypothetical protein
METTMSTKTMTELRRLETVAEAAELRTRKAASAQRVEYERVRQHDISVRSGGKASDIPFSGIAPPMRGPGATLTATEKAARLEQIKLNDCELRHSTAKAHLAGIRGELRALRELERSAERESLARMVITGDATDAQNAKLLELCPDDFNLPCDEQVLLSPQVNLALKLLGLKVADQSDIDRPCNELLGMARFST